jgi:iron(III) transport system permease protein
MAAEAHQRATARGVARHRPAYLGWRILILGVIGPLALAPIAALIFLAATASPGVWLHLLSTVLPGATVRTLGLLVGVGMLTVMIGVSTAWLVAMCRFPGRRIFEWLLLLPLAMPTYIVAYAYVEILDYVGPVQSGLRAIFGWTSPRDYWFPDIRSLGGAIFLFAFVLYPYVYLTTRATFLMQSMCVIDVSRTLGRSAWGSFFQVALPLARPGIVVGITLVSMETLNDIGAVEYLGVNTLTLSVYSTWVNRGDLGAAAQIACVMLLFVIALIWLERRGRRMQRFHHTSRRQQALPDHPLTGWRAYTAVSVCLLPVVIGFVVPAALLAEFAITRFSANYGPQFWLLVRNSLTVSVLAALVAVAVGLILTYGARLTNSATLVAAGRLSSVGYAVPGTILAIGILVPLAAFDNALDGAMRALFGIGTGLLLTGTVAALVYAYVVRFLAVSYGALEAGLQRVTPHLDMAARSLGRSAAGALREVHLPMLRPAVATAAILVFVDSMKELPATILLRPFGFDTLATHVYTYASLARVENGALAALAIVAVGLLPVALLAYTSRLPMRMMAAGGGRGGSGSAAPA